MKNYFKLFNHLSGLSVFIMIFVGGCPASQPGKGTYPSPEKWPQECSFFTPFTVQYDALFSVKEKKDFRLEGVPNAKVTCKLISVVQLPHPFIPDTCYQKTSVFDTFTLFTIDEGLFLGSQNKVFNYTFGSKSDYFTIEVLVEKPGYFPKRKTKDFRYFWEDERREWLPHNSVEFSHIKERNLSIDLVLLLENTNP